MLVPSGDRVLHTDDRFADATEAAVTRIEGGTDAEIVVVAAPRSGSYRDVAVICGAAAAWALLVFAVVSPLWFSPLALLIEAPALGIFVAWAVHRSPAALRRLTGRDRRARQVAEAAAAAFHEEAVHGTRGRTGLLVYFSALEDRVVLLPDAGVEAVVPGAAWNAIRWGGEGAAPGDLDHFLAGLGAVGDVLARHLPPTGGNPDEIANAPRIRP